MSKAESQLCWSCANCTDSTRCSWVDDGTPVAGWVAEHVPARQTKWSRHTETYFVKECPKFVADLKELAYQQSQKKMCS
jgi:hypothetical protein